MTYTNVSWDDFVQCLAYDRESMTDEAWETYIEQLEWLHSHPLNINAATPEEMALVPFLTPAQIEAIQAYVHLDGPMKSLGELALIPALDSETRKVLPLFFVAGQEARQTGSKTSVRDYFKGMSNSVDTRIDIPMYYRRGYQTGAYKNNPIYNRIRWALDSRHIMLGAHLKKDPGEGFYDSWGGYLMLKNKGIVQSAILGDYRAGWGEGLVISRGSSSGKSNLMSGTSQGVRPMTGLSESGFLRGFAITLAQEDSDWKDKNGVSLSGTLFGSYKSIDATLNDAGEIQTIVENGNHRTETELKKKNNASFALLGAHVGASYRHFHFGVSGYWQYFNRPLSPGTNEYRKWYPRGQHFGVIGLYGNYSYYKWTVGTEVAYSFENNGIAVLGKAHWLINRNWKVGMLGRYYDHRYYSFQAAAIGENSRVQNETGVMFRIEGSLWRGIHLTAFADFFADFWPRYGMTTSSQGQEFMLEARYEPSVSNTISVRYQMKRKATNDIILPLHRTKVQWTFLPQENWKLQTTGAVHFSPTLQTGFGISQTAHFTTLKTKALHLGVMAGYFNAPDYATRIYIYEPSLWNSSSSYSYYGHGIRIASTVRYMFPKSHWTIELKYSLTHMFDRNTMSSGMQEILSPSRNDISIQLRMKY
ncbi:MAG: helix-hairpin-helix domain-containing protein [Bacteroidaceae bacterium]|nr:helix-hairpin-helix domain-containing protein [Bacteroidaceae bacterium]